MNVLRHEDKRDQVKDVTLRCHGDRFTLHLPREIIGEQRHASITRKRQFMHHRDIFEVLYRFPVGHSENYPNKTLLGKPAVAPAECVTCPAGRNVGTGPTEDQNVEAPDPQARNISAQAIW